MKVAALVPDLLFGSRVQSMLEGAGHEVWMCSTEADARARAADADVLVVDLTQDPAVGTALVESLAPGATRTLGFYSHVEADVRERALAAGFDAVVPRSRMAREGGELVARLADTPGRG